MDLGGGGAGPGRVGEELGEGIGGSGVEWAGPRPREGRGLSATRGRSLELASGGDWRRGEGGRGLEGAGIRGEGRRDWRRRKGGA